MAPRQRFFLPAIGIGLVGAMMACSDGRAKTSVSGADGPLMPVEVAGWRSVDDGQAFDTESSYKYIEGHAEV